MTNRMWTAIIAAGFATIASAEPGTPSWIKAEAWSGSVAKLPYVSVTFKGWKEKVRFLVAATRDGQPWYEFHKNVTLCPISDTTGNPPQFQCAWPVKPTARPNEGFHSTPGVQGYSMGFRNLDWDSEYCFRIRTQDERGEYAKLWSGWACARTNVSPPSPGAPYGIEITGLPGESGRGQVGDGKPERLLVEWISGLNTAGFVVEKAPLVPNARFEPVSTAPRGPLGAGDRELAFTHRLDLDNPIQIRVCAESVIGRTCSIAKRFPPRDLKDNARAGDVPKHGRPPITSPDTARAGASVTPQTPPVTATNATKATPATPPPVTSTSVTKPGSSFSRNSGGLH